MMAVKDETEADIVEVRVIVMRPCASARAQSLGEKRKKEREAKTETGAYLK